MTGFDAKKSYSEIYHNILLWCCRHSSLHLIKLLQEFFIRPKSEQSEVAAPMAPPQAERASSTAKWDSEIAR